MTAIKKVKKSEKKTNEAEGSIPKAELPVTPIIVEKEQTSKEQVQDIPKGWIKVTSDQVVIAEKARKLVGFDSSKMIALIKE